LRYESVAQYEQERPVYVYMTVVRALAEQTRHQSPLHRLVQSSNSTLFTVQYFSHAVQRRPHARVTADTHFHWPATFRPVAALSSNLNSRPASNHSTTQHQRSTQLHPTSALPNSIADSRNRGTHLAGNDIASAANSSALHDLGHHSLGVLQVAPTHR
jgi:hypothetical protein